VGFDMTTYLLIRHGTTAWVDKAVAGDTPGVHLCDEGRRQANGLADRLCQIPIAAIYSSPLERAVESAEPLAARLALTISTHPRLTEIGFGHWSGKQFSELEGDPLWARFNRFRSSTRPPGGELMTEVQARIVDEMEQLRVEHPDKIAALFSHGDVIRAAVAFYSGIPLDLMHRLEISPASVSVITLADWGPQVLGINNMDKLCY
jgi:probable phosphoglycerate mutase